MSSAFLVIVLLDHAFGSSKVTDHVRWVWLEKLFMDLLALYNSSLSRSSRSVQLAWVSHYYSSSDTLHFFSFSHPICCDASITLALPMQYYNLDPGSYKGLPSPLPTTAPALIFIAREIQNLLPSSVPVDLHLPTAATRFQQLVFPFTPIYFCKKITSTKLTTVVI